MKTPFSDHLTREAPHMRALIDRLAVSFEYVSILSTDSVGFMLRVTPRVKRVDRKTMTTERGHVVRLYRDQCYYEYAFNDFDPERIEQKADEITAAFERQRAVLAAEGVKPYETACLPDEAQELDAAFDTGRLPSRLLIFSASLRAHTYPSFSPARSVISLPVDQRITLGWQRSRRTKAVRSFSQSVAKYWL